MPSWRMVPPPPASPAAGAPQAEGSRSKKRRRVSDAYCSLLHGGSDHFLVYALIVGVRLKRLCRRRADRVLLCAGPWWENPHSREALRSVWTHVIKVDLIHAPHATLAPRHTCVFSKLEVFRLPYRRVVFLDLDLVPMADLSPLFEVPAPAAMHHGACSAHLAHGELIPKDAMDYRWCVNAGVMRLDPMRTSEQRKRHFERMAEEVQEIRRPTMLPEQYFLVNCIDGWRHLHPRWNMEVGAIYDDPGFVWPRRQARQVSAKPGMYRGQQWREQDVSKVRVFHFSGTKLSPWWYSDMTPEQALEEVQRDWRFRDPRHLLATTIHAWLSALEELELEETAGWAEDVRQPFVTALSRLRKKAWEYRCWEEAERRNGFQCHRCQRKFLASEGRCLVGYEGWWGCSDCVVGYIFSDEVSDPGRCVRCGTCSGKRWKMVGDPRSPEWYCGPCYDTWWDASDQSEGCWTPPDPEAGGPSGGWTTATSSTRASHSTTGSSSSLGQPVPKSGRGGGWGRRHFHKKNRR